MKKYISLLLSLIMTVSLALPCFATDSAASSGISGGGGGGGYVSGTVAATPAKATYTAEGTIYLPDGFCAPQGGLEIYGGFGGVSLSGISLMSAAEEEVSVEYEKVELIATIPEGESKVSYSKTFSLSAAYDGFYGELWIYDTDIESDGKYISNKCVISNIAKIKADTYLYSGINATLCEADSDIDYSVSFDEALAEELPEQEIYIIADDGYDRYVTKHSIDSCTDTISGTLRTEGSDFDLKYYIPKTTKVNNQKIQTGQYSIGTASLDTVNEIVVAEQVHFEGYIKRPNTDDYLGEINLKISTSLSEVYVTIGQGQAGADYVVAAATEEEEYLKVEVISPGSYASGYYYDGDAPDFTEYAEYYWYMNEPHIVDMTLKKQCVISGEITLPQTVTMAEDTYFKVYVCIENTDLNYSDSSVCRVTDGKAEYKFSVPMEYRSGNWEISYHYGSYEDVEIPASITSPLKPYRGAISGGGASGGGGGSSSINLVFEEPEGLLYNFRFFVTESGFSILQNEAKSFVFETNVINFNIELLDESFVIDNIISGYIDTALSLPTDPQVKISLIDASDYSVVERISPANDGSYSFSGFEDGVYIVGVSYYGRDYYYSDGYLIEDIASATVFDTSEKKINYSVDFWYDNVFRTNIKAVVRACEIDGITYEHMPISIYDIYGQKRLQTSCFKTFPIFFSPFVMKVGHLYVKQREYPFTITELTDNVEEAMVFEAEYYDRLDYYTRNYPTLPITVRANYGGALCNTHTIVRRGSDGSLKATVAINNDYTGASIIVAAYENNVLAKMQIITCESGVYQYKAAFEEAEAVTEVKVMLWDSTDLMSPIGLAEEVL